jgi:hypothetical protein
MFKKILVVMKYPIFIVAILVGIVSCEKDFKNIGENLLDDNLFSTGSYSAQIKAHSIRVNSNKTNGMGHYLLGYTTNTQFGSLSASIVAQMSLPESNPDFGNNAVIDSVVITIPYLSTLDGTQDATDPNDPTKTIKVPNYELDSVFTSGTNPNFQLNVFELGTYLNPLDPNNPYVENELFSDDVFLKTGSPLYSGLVSPNRNDTLMVINRYQYENASLTNRILYKKDTIKLANSKPSMKIPMNKQRIKQIFQDNASSSHFASNENFKHYFRGLYFEALNSGNGTAAMYLNLAEAYMTIYYSQTTVDDETAEEDLNGNGIKGELNIVYPTAETFVYSLSGIRVNLFERNYNGTLAENYLLNPNVTNGDDKIFVQGAAGSDGIVHLFGADANTNDIPDEIETLRTKNWLINDAKLYLYVDPSNSTDQYPSKLYLYGIENGLNYQTYEIMNQGITQLGGDLVLDDEDNPDYYLFHLTDYVSEILKPDTEVTITDFGIKVYDSSDLPLSATDTIMRKYNNNFKGVVLTGKNVSLAPRNLKLDIFYTEKNQ